MVKLQTLVCNHRAIQSYSEKYNPNHGGFEIVAFFQAVGEFLLIFTLPLILGSTLGIATSLVTYSAPFQSGSTFNTGFFACS